MNEWYDLAKTDLCVKNTQIAYLISSKLVCVEGKNILLESVLRVI